MGDNFEGREEIWRGKNGSQTLPNMSHDSHQPLIRASYRCSSLALKATDLLIGFDINYLPFKRSFTFYDMKVDLED